MHNNHIIRFLFLPIFHLCAQTTFRTEQTREKEKQKLIERSAGLSYFSSVQKAGETRRKKEIKREKSLKKKDLKKRIFIEKRKEKHCCIKA